MFSPILPTVLVYSGSQLARVSGRERNCEFLVILTAQVVSCKRAEDNILNQKNIF